MKQTRSKKNKKVKETQAQRGREAFLRFHEAAWGERWPALLASLTEPQPKIEMQNPWPGKPSYFLDAASMLVAEQVEVAKNGRWLDLCSAPGGKALAVIFRLKGDVRSVLNEFSRERRARLKAVLYDHLPAEVLSDRCQVTGHDGQRWGLFEQKSYDAVLVDAPCSGERHLLKTPRELGQWKLSRSKILQVRQHALLCAALEAVKPGGVVVYSTCSLSSVENDGVIAKLQKSRAERFELLPLVGEANSVGEPTEFGRIFLPDRGAGMGPMYVARLRAL